MNWSFVIFDSVLIVFILAFEKPLIKKMKKKLEKIVFFGFLIIGYGLSFLLSIYPDIQGPSQWIEFLFRPLGIMLEK